MNAEFSETMNNRMIRICAHCDWVSRIPLLNKDESALCPRCNHRLVIKSSKPLTYPIAYAIAALIMLLVSFSFVFIFFTTAGITQVMYLQEAVSAPYYLHYAFLAFCFLIGCILLPLIFLLITLYVHLALAFHWQHPFAAIYFTRALKRLQPWLVSDIFIIGILVSLVKIMSLAEIGIGISFWAYCLFALFLLLTVITLDYEWLFNRLCGPMRVTALTAGQTALLQGYTVCHGCGQAGKINSQGRGHCRRCGEGLKARIQLSLQLTLALIIAALIFYFFSMTLPVMIIHRLNDSNVQTILSGVWYLLHDGDFPVALVIFFASITVPLIKFIGLIWLCWKTRYIYPLRLAARMKLYRLIKFIGRWSMIDVFVVTVLSAMVQLGSFMNIVPGQGIIFFGLVVILTMIAEMCFDPRLLWDSLSIEDNAQVMSKLNSTPQMQLTNQ